jgi:hypothetical protein
MSSNERPLSKSTPGFTPGPDAVISRIVSHFALDFAKDSRNAFSITHANETLSSIARCLAEISNWLSRFNVVRMAHLFAIDDRGTKYHQAKHIVNMCQYN